MTQQETKAVNDAAVNQNTYVESEVVDAFIAGAQFLDELRKPSEPETNVGEAGKNVSKQAIIARLKRIGFTRMDEPNHYANDLGLSFAFDQNSKYSIANSNGYILISTDDVFDAFKLLQPDNELLEAAKDALRTFYGIGCNEEAEIVQVLTKAILNYEKQSK